MGNSLVSIDVKSSRELMAIVLAMKQTERTLAKVIRARTKMVVEPEWVNGVQSRVKGITETRVLGSTARAAVADSNVTLRAGVGARRLSGGWDSSTPGTRGPNLVRATEFGGNQLYTKTYSQRSTRGNKYQLKRHTQRQLTSARKLGPVYSTAEDLVPRIASLWVQTVVKVLASAMEGKNL